MGWLKRKIAGEPVPGPIAAAPPTHSKDFSGKDALAGRKTNPQFSWVKGDGAAMNRIHVGRMVPEGTQSFSLGRTDSVFAIGSCFARNIERHLMECGVNVLSRNLDVPGLTGTVENKIGIFNKYHPVAIYQELLWARHPELVPYDSFLPSRDGKYQDPFLSNRSPTGTLDDLKRRREVIGRFFRQAFEADVIIMTLGLIEIWQDQVTGAYLNSIPNPQRMKAHSDRIRFRVLSLADCIEAMDKAFDLLSEGGKRPKIVITTSPVPMTRTFTQSDVVVANTLSKSTLRLTAEHLSAKHEGVDYFPSYEAVLNSEPSLAWREDKLHVHPDMVDCIMSAFLSRYMEGGEALRPVREPRRRRDAVES